LPVVHATPATTVNAVISASIKNDGNLSPYIKVDKGTFSMKAKVSGISVTSSTFTPDTSESEEQYQILTSFGMFWHKDKIEWNAEITWNATNWFYSS
jgi:hypothetical protein